MKIRAAVPRLEDHGHRDRLWRFCHRYWRKELPDMEIVEGHHKSDRPFNRSASINRAADGDWDVLVILDSDVIVDPGQITTGAELAARTGKLVLPFERRQMLNRQGTQKILSGYMGNWNRFVGHSERDRVSCCVIVPRSLWELVGGFDERFEGWGGEDEAFHAACREMAGVERTAGKVWHLHHRPSPFNHRESPTHRQALQLSLRYERAAGSEAMGRLLAEPRTPEQIAVVVLTNAKRDTLAVTIASAEEKLRGPVSRCLIVVDGSEETAAKVKAAHPTWDVEEVRGGNYVRATAAAVDRAIGCGQPWVFFLEDDFTFNQTVDLANLRAVMERNPELGQLALLRQPWYRHETEAGGLFAAKPDAYRQRDGFVEHQDHWTHNPMLVRREVLASFKWPKGPGSEKRFGDAVYATGLRTGVLGTLDDPPLVTHNGYEQAGHGY